MRTWSTARATTLAAALLAAATLVPGTAGQAHAAGPSCAPGELCLWAKPDFKGTRQTYDLSTVAINSCITLPAGNYQSLVNRIQRQVTAYQSAECAETGQFETYSGNGVWLPASPYQIRAFKVWET
ncbi:MULTISPECIES: peptidase inhibitor family I36 protein [Streptomyces]|uniref:Peptidase inhibitor family I36 protein n=1 Tax=Streptomyces katrae TaxID=68223 RepID=A0ABT7GZK1_9ACTN|nr:MULTISPECIES: peptidase inhibitor family I36 protein [Streptomyces]MDK9499055.1 peptidase inhibitor family I36 protein [Streptomyces katrae]RST03379.1 hypothetical protein EF910_20760 [Streptomyces sp. WAC07149]GLX23989.1 hypothetical protein Slala01_76330 [Streptomyces lavendulae subsp. lavendulae]GLX31857.1 hypothetical protein Slala02_76760 [Streptomyces lavendulae subsp. lavendulae]